MSITQERMIALLTEMEKAIQIFDTLKDMAEKEIDLTNNIFAHMVQKEIGGFSPRCFWIEKVHFNKNAKSNMYRALKKRAERDSKTQRPLLGLRQHEAANQVVSNVYKGVQVKSNTELAIENAEREIDTELRKRVEAAYDEIVSQNPAIDRVKALNEATRIANAATPSTQQPPTSGPSTPQPTAQMLSEKEKDRLRDEAQIPRGSLF